MRRSHALRSCAPAWLLLGALLACKKSAPTSESGAAPSAPAIPATSTAAPSSVYVSERDLERVCSGEQLPSAKTYDRARGGVHPTIVLTAKFQGGAFEKQYDKSLDAWKATDNK